MRIAALLLAIAFGASAATINVGSNQEFTNALLSVAANGDTINVTNSFTLLQSTLLNRNISLEVKGQGSNTTHITLTSGLAYGFGVGRISTNYLMSIHDIDWIGSDGAGNASGTLNLGVNFPAAKVQGAFRIYNCQFTNTISRAINAGGGDFFGLIDHCYFETIAGASFTVCSIDGNEYVGWTNLTDNPLGTTNAVYVEDCYFKNNSGNIGNGFFDAYNGSQYVLRHNVFDGDAANGCHGYDSQPTSMRTLEVYNNLYTNLSSSSCGVGVSRGGVYLCFSNTAYASGAATANTVAPVLQYYRACHGIVPGVDQTIGSAGYPWTNTYTTNFPNGVQVSVGFSPAYTFDTVLGASARHVLAGANLGESLTNLALCINNDPATAGVKYSQASTNKLWGARNPDAYCIYSDATQIAFTNIMDGSNAFGWPAAFQSSTLAITEYTNTKVLFPCYFWSNVVTISGTPRLLAVGLAYQGLPCDGANYVDGLLQNGRDFYTNVIPSAVTYTPLVYPHPLARGGATNSVAIVTTLRSGHSEIRH